MLCLDGRGKKSMRVLYAGHKSVQEEALFEEMKEIEAAIQPDNIVFVMDATQGGGGLNQLTLMTGQEKPSPCQSLAYMTILLCHNRPGGLRPGQGLPRRRHSG
jgi:hypothetical protein